jgi:superfamily II DNA or RNA helicase
MIELRSYQQQTIRALRNSMTVGNRRMVLCAPTGAGKTVMFSHMVSEHIKRGGRALVVTDRLELMRQAGGAFERIGLTPELIKAGSNPDLTLPCHVAMVETLSRRAERYATFLASRTMVIFDEAHKCPFDKLFPYLSAKCFVIGATATPYRSGNQSALDDFYTDIVQCVDTPHLVNQGFLADADTYGVEMDLSGIKKVAGDYDTAQLAQRYEERKVYDGVIQNYNRICPNTKALAFCSNIDSAVSLTKQLVSAGLPARCLDSTMSDEDRREKLAWLSETPNAILVSVGILTTGFDEPSVQTIILYRATTSLPLFLQMVGRGSRVTQNKRRFTILDFGNNIKTHNFWEAERVWSLEKKQKKLDVAPVKSCPKCDAMLPVAAPACKYCGYEFKRKSEEKEAGEFAHLVKLPKPKILQAAGSMTLAEKARLCKTKGIDGKPVIKWAWVMHNLTDVSEAREFIKLMGFKKGWEYHNKERYNVFQDDRENRIEVTI